MIACFSSLVMTLAPIGAKRKKHDLAITIPTGMKIIVTKHATIIPMLARNIANPKGNHMMFAITPNTLLITETFSLPFMNVSRTISLPNGKYISFPYWNIAFPMGIPIIVRQNRQPIRM